MTIIKKNTNNKCWWGYGEKWILIHGWWECKLVQPLWKTVWRFLKTLKKNYYMTQQFYSWVHIWEEKLIWKDTCTSMFIAALFTIAKVCKRPKCPSTDEWIKKMCYINTKEYYLVTKKNKILPFAAATRMDLEGIIVSESDRERQMLYHLYVESKTNNKLVNITTKKEADSQIERTRQWLPVAGHVTRGWAVGGTINWE